MIECQKAFDDLKSFLINPPVLSTSVPGKDLYLYITVRNTMFSSMLVELKVDFIDLFIM